MERRIASFRCGRGQGQQPPVALIENGAIAGVIMPTSRDNATEMCLDWYEGKELEELARAYPQQVAQAIALQAYPDASGAVLVVYASAPDLPEQEGGK